MAKKLVAVTDIRHDGKDYAAGSTLNKDEFTQDQLKQLYDNGAVKIEDTDDKEATSSAAPDTSAPEEPAVENPNE